MRILQVHNSYKYAGGEDVVMAAEGALLLDHGHTVREYRDGNQRTTAMSHVEIASNLFWSRRTTRAVRRLVCESRPDIAHVHNIWYVVSPSIFYELKANRIPVVQTLHNYRMGCANARLIRDGVPCESCLRLRSRWPAIRHRCFHGSAARTAALVGAMGVHRALRSFDLVDVFVALTEFARQLHIASGVPADKILVKPNFVFPEPQPGSGSGEFCLFVGRLDVDKGVRVLLNAVKELRGRIRVKIAGDGPLAAEVQRAASENAGLEYLGPQSRDRVIQLMQEATCLVLPSQAYENFPVVIAEAFAAALPVIASARGALTELIDHERTGLLFQAESCSHLSSQIDWLFRNRARVRQMRLEARSEFDRKYSAEINYQHLQRIYEFARAQASRA